MLKNILFPQICINCGAYGAFLCTKCMRVITQKTFQNCPMCDELSDMGAVCQRCASSMELSSVIIACEHSDLLRFVIHQYKYRFITMLAEYLGTFLERTWSFQIGHTEGFFLVPIPIHKKRRRYRGFNQTELLAKELSKVLGMEICECLTKSIHTKPQMELNREERINNIGGSFTLSAKIPKRYSKALLVDDVMTTGSTLRECARVLKSSPHIREVWAVVLTRGV